MVLDGSGILWMDDSRLNLSSLAISKGGACMILWKHILRRIVLLTENLVSVCLRLRASNQRPLPRVRQDTENFCAWSSSWLDQSS